MVTPGPTTRRGGFSLMELVVVIALLGLAYGLIFLKLDTMLPGSRLESSARLVASELERVRNHAVVSGKRIVVEYDLQAAAFRAYYPYELAEDGRTILGDGQTTLVDWQALPDTVRIRDVRIGEGDPIVGGVVAVWFEPRGIATGHVVHLAVADDGGDEVYTVLVSPILGFARIEAGDVPPEVLEDAF